MAKNRPLEEHDEEVATPEEEESMRTMTRERVITRLKEKQSSKIADARALLEDARNDSDASNEVEDLDRKIRAQERATLGKKLGAEHELTPEQAELLASLEKQYPQWQEVFAHYEVPTDEMPTWEEVRTRFLPPEVLEAALHQEKPTLNMTPPLTRQEIKQHFDDHKVTGQKYNTGTYELEDDELWSDGKLEKDLKWEVHVVEGVQDVPADPAINPDKMNNAEMAEAWVKKLKEKGLKPLSGARRYLSLMMKALQEGNPVDPNTYTVLNAETRKEAALLSNGDWLDAQVSLYYDYPGYGYVNLRLRGSAGVDTN